jgi:hypothetical protein
MASGVGFVVLFAVGLMVATGQLPNTSGLHTQAAVDAKVFHTYDKAGTRAAIIVGGYLIVLAGLVLIWFLSGLRSRLRRGGESETVSGLVFTFGAIAAVMIMAGGGIFATIAGDLSFGNEPAIHTADVARLLPEIGFPLVMIGGMLALGAVIAITSVAALRNGVLPRWLAYAGWLAVVGAALAVVFLPMVLVALWILAVSIIGFRTKADVPAGTGSDRVVLAPPRSQQPVPAG